MITCERCGKEMRDTAAFCPACGTAVSAGHPVDQAAIYHEPYPPGPGTYYHDSPSQRTYERGYEPQQLRDMPPRQENRAQQGYAYGAPYAGARMQQQGFANVVAVMPKDNTPLIVEILLSIFLGVYGVGWLMAGRKTVGIILLLCSFFINWPLLALSFIFLVLTLGLGVFCVGPFVIGAIILNAVLLNNFLRRKAAQFVRVH